MELDWLLLKRLQDKGVPIGIFIRDAYQLRVNAYRVLLTRARDACVVYVPPIPFLDETFEFLRGSGFRLLAGP